jgi:hypothetical protein
MSLTATQLSKMQRNQDAKDVSEVSALRLVRSILAPNTAEGSVVRQITIMPHMVLVSGSRGGSAVELSLEDTTQQSRNSLARWSSQRGHAMSSAIQAASSREGESVDLLDTLGNTIRWSRWQDEGTRPWEVKYTNDNQERSDWTIMIKAAPDSTPRVG